MQAYKEITVWDSASAPNHTYLLDGDTLVAYIRKGTVEPYYFRSPIKGFSKTGRKFEVLKANPFDVPKAEVMPWIKQVAGSKSGVVYTVNLDDNTCTCPGYVFRGSCKHVKELEAQ